ncbi:MAG: hypothetical protein ACJAS1_006932 [Oleiphilaceae bacterium]|jgi:hypothetical protein
MFNLIYLAIVFVGVIAMFWFQGHLGRWGKLQTIYPTEDIPIMSYMIGGVSFQKAGSGFNRVCVGTNETGLYLYVKPILRCFYPSIVIPWLSITDCTMHKADFHKRALVRAKGVDFQIELPANAYESIVKYVSLD